MTPELLNETIVLLATLRKDAKWALKGKWNPCGEGMEGFEAQIELINRVLPKLKELQK